MPPGTQPAGFGPDERGQLDIAGKIDIAVDCHELRTQGVAGDLAGGKSGAAEERLIHVSSLRDPADMRACVTLWRKSGPKIAVPVT